MACLCVELVQLLVLSHNQPKQAKSATQLKNIEVRMLSPISEVDNVTNTILFLLSDQSAMINGTSIVVDGGFSCH